MAADLPTSAAITSPTVTNAQQKLNLGAIATFLLNLLGNDSSNKVAARAALGVDTAITAGLALIPGRNLLTNGNFNINQRGYVSAAATTGANQYTLDRWRVVTSGQNLAFTASGNGNVVTAPAGGLEQVVEGANIGSAAGVISWTGTATCTVDGVAKTNGATVTLVPGTNCTVRFTGGTVSKAQLEYGSVPTVFEYRLVPVETTLCQRYWVPLELSIAATGASVVANAGNFPTTMRIAPTYTRISGGLSGGTAPTTLTTTAQGYYFERVAQNCGGLYGFSAEI